MNIVSGCVQLCKVTREFAYNISHTGFIHKAKSCQSSIQKSVLHLKTELRKHFRIDFQNKAASPFRDDELPDTQREFFGLRTSPDPAGLRSSPSPTGLRTSPSPTGNGASLPDTGNGSLNHEQEELEDGNRGSSRSSLAPSEFSFSTGSLSR